jgi:hypothetical protein
VHALDGDAQHDRSVHRIQKAAWTLTGQGSVPNPSGSGAIVQTVSE